MNFKELRQELTDEMLKDILAQFNVEPVEEDSDRIIFPTCCHNLEGGSPKLYYFKDSKLFHCFTECSSSFDIFTLLQKMMSLRGKEITLRQAVSLCDLNINEASDKEDYCGSIEDIQYMQELNNTYIPNISDLNFKSYDASVLKKYSFDYLGFMPWLEEGIGIEALQKFNIRYDNYNQAIVIPNFDYDGKLIGVRGRFFRPEDIMKGKYRPIYKGNGEWYNHPTGRTFYGIYENKYAIERKHICVIFEGEKSVLLYGSIYGVDNNIALATLGQNITKDHIQYLLKMKVTHVILAYDTDYEDYKQLAEVEQKYIQKAKILSPYFNVSILMDYDFDLPYKSSPIDGGKDIFEKMLKNRRIIK
jgi:DNA primase